MEKIHDQSDRRLCGSCFNRGLFVLLIKGFWCTNCDSAPDDLTNAK